MRKSKSYKRFASSWSWSRARMQLHQPGGADLNTKVSTNAGPLRNNLNRFKHIPIKHCGSLIHLALYRRSMALHGRAGGAAGRPSPALPRFVFPQQQTFPLRPSAALVGLRPILRGQGSESSCGVISNRGRPINLLPFIHVPIEI